MLVCGEFAKRELRQWRSDSANLSDSDWEYTSSGAVAVFGEGTSDCTTYSPEGNACEESWSLSEHGRLYNWYAVADSSGLLPGGWHVPTPDEWTVLVEYLGGANAAGGQMKSDYGWHNNGNGTNSSGFSGLPGGFRGLNGKFFNAGYDGAWWTSAVAIRELHLTTGVSCHM